MIDAVFSAEGLLARKLADYEERSEQIEMAERILSAYEKDKIALIEAGTGIGKSLAYLVPAIYWALKTKEKTIISTYTIALQEQLMEKDLPFILDVLDADILAVLVKGMGNYVCLRKGRQNGFEDIEKWGPSRSELSFPMTQEAWHKVNAEADLCTGAQCTDFKNCFFFKARRAVGDAQILVVNHRLLLSDLFSEEKKALPEVDRIIIDEAHRLEDVALDALSYRIEREGLLRLVHLMGDDPELKASIEKAFETGDKEAFLYLARTFKKIAAAAEENIYAVRLKREAQKCEHYFSEKDQTSVRWKEEQRSLCFAPLNASESLKTALFDKTATVCLCSATLTAGKDFSYTKERLGISEETRVEEMSFESPFDYEKQTLFLVPTDLPYPTESAFRMQAAQFIVETLRLSRGNAFLLFTSYEMLSQFYDTIGAMTHEFTLLKQGEGSKQALLDKFRGKEGSVLFGTDSFWEGVDVAGEALRCVIILKLPFKVPDDPWLKAYADSLTQQGRNPFLEYAVPQAVMKFKQGFGRLMRKKNDRGCILCLDRRMVAKGYGKVFAQSVPPARQVFAAQKELLKEMDKFWSVADSNR